MGTKHAWPFDGPENPEQLPFEDVLAPAVVAAVLVAVVRFVLSILTSLGHLAIVSSLVWALIGAVSTVTFVGGVVYVVVLGPQRDVLTRAGVVVYAGGLLERLLRAVSGNGSAVDLGTILWPLGSVALVFGIAYALDRIVDDHPLVG